MSVTSASQHLYLAKINERHVLQVIRDQGPSSRAEIVRHSGLQRTDGLEGRGVTSKGAASRGGGRQRASRSAGPP